MNWDWEKLKDRQRQSGGGGGTPPQVEDIINKFKEFKLPGGPILIIIVLFVIVVWTSVFRIQVDEVGVIQRFGKYVRTETSGLNWKLPLGIETLSKVNVTQIRTEGFGAALVDPREKSRFRYTGSSESHNNMTLMLTGDLNVAEVPWIVQYKVKDPYNYLFKVRDVQRILVDMSEASMRLVVGDRSINEVISKRNEIAVEAKEQLQKELDQAETGIHVVTIEMKKTNVPKPVQPSFNEVNQATQEKEQMIYQAKEDYNKAIPAARGEAERTIRAGEGYALDRINRAKGDANRFNALYKEYAKAKDITKRRLYLEALKELFPKLGQKFIIDSNQKNLLPLLNLNKDNGVIK